MVNNMDVSHYYIHNLMNNDVGLITGNKNVI